MVKTSTLMLKQAQRWRTLLLSHQGCHFCYALPRSPEPPLSSRVFHIFSDAALDGARIPSLGGCAHGRWWTFPLFRVMPIAHLELIGAIFGLFILWEDLGFKDITLPDDLLIWMHVDGLATPQDLAAHAANSHMMQYIHLRFMEHQAYKQLAPHLVCGHIFGDGNDVV